MHLNCRVLVFVAPLFVAACVTPPRTYTPAYSAPQAKVFPDIVHAYELLVKDSASRPVEGALVTFTATVEGKCCLANCFPASLSRNLVRAGD